MKKSINKLNSTSTEEEIMILELIIIGNWAKTCKTKEQLDVVENFLNKKSSIMFKDKNFGSAACFNLGVVCGIILSLNKIKFSS
jgi:hypothetical protein